jgi:predicted enzyme related to lactoylglutathione lyase
MKRMSCLLVDRFGCFYSGRRTGSREIDKPPKFFSGRLVRLVSMIEYPHGTPSWVDLSSPDPDASARFYGGLFGWECAATAGSAEETGGYRIFSFDGSEVAGLGPLQPGAPPAWTTYIAVDDAAAARDAIEEAGGRTLLDPLEVMDAGTMAVFSDAPGGAQFAVWQAGRNRGAQHVNAVGGLAMNELDTRDMDGAARFYRAVFGWEVRPIEVEGTVVYGSVTLGGRLVAGMLPMGDAFPPQVPPSWVPYFGVEDVEASGSRAVELGGQKVMGPRVVPGGRFTVLRDPHGAAFCVLEASYDPPPGG